ncbi:hypothetical protein EMPS_00713 [Entomortierella parvispora]|uniref:Uncharacterized protein n=1 Tax=Entomortierella parvispora TaxID=205924 RepID=A0A9P3H1L1_9FUNG|nr:hypothetical protein EMPS_00713 [Entomortierella parvispora]
MSFHPVLLMALLESSPKLDELSMDGCGPFFDDSNLAMVLSKVPSPGWKTLGFKNLPKIGPLTVSVILGNSATLENLRLTNCEAFDSKSIQKLLCSAPNLNRLDCISASARYDLELYSLMSKDIVESGEDWVCLGLEAFKCSIGGVPRPDITYRGNGSLLTSIYNDKTRFSTPESRTVRRQVLAQLGRLTKLQEITLGMDVTEYSASDRVVHDDGQAAGNEYDSPTGNERGYQYQCLTMSLQDGLDELRNLKCLRRLTLEKMSLGIGAAERTWMEENWPEYEKISGNTTSTLGGRQVDVGSNRPFELFMMSTRQFKSPIFMTGGIHGLSRRSPFPRSVNQ